mgnify:CR=1 FL=1
MTETSYTEWWHTHRDRIEASADVRVDVFVRSLGAPTDTQARQARVLERLDDLEEMERIDRFTVQVWGDRLYPDERCAQSPVGRFLDNKITEFERWADSMAGVELSFESKVCEPFVADREFHCIVLPRICLATYIDGELDGVVPCTFGNENVTVDDYLTALHELSTDPLSARERGSPVTAAEGT